MQLRPQTCLGRNPERFPKMSISSKILTAIVLAVALAPMAAQADRDPQPGPAQYYLAPLNHQDQVMASSATMGGNRASANYGGQYAPNAVTSAVPTQNGFAGEVVCPLRSDPPCV